MDNKLKTVDAETLLSTPMSKTMFIVDGLISQGVNVISGASKIGKSWLMLWLGLQVAQGNSVWGLPTLQCDVLYLSLEDTQRRIKDRLYNLTDSAPDNLYFAVTSGLIGGGLEEQITDFLTEHSATKLVIIDTLQKVRDSKGSAGKAGMYGNDYDDISSIKRIADGFNIAILLVHHLRKLQDSDDPFNDVSGSTGIIGAADTNFILRRKRSGNAATLLVSGRDVEYQELTLQFNDLVWELVERKNSEDIHKAELPKFLFRVVDFKAEELKRNASVEGRASENRQDLLIVDAINEAINARKKIAFQYFAYNIRKQKKLRHDGERYIFSPYRLIWNGDYYYVLGYSDKHQAIGSFRVDRISARPDILSEEAVPVPADFGVDDFLATTFRMYGSECQEVELMCRMYGLDGGAAQ